MFWHKVMAELLRQECQSSIRARWDGKMSETSEQGWSKVEWENVGNVGAKVEQGGMGKCRKHWSKVGGVV